MERKYSTLIVFFSLLVLVTLSGFGRSYLSHFPEFGRFPWLIHLHFLLFFIWLMLLIIQPVLIRKRKFRLHRALGKTTYFLAPLLVISILLLVQIKVKRIFPDSAEAASVEALIGLMDAISFSLYYVLAICFRKNLRRHVAFMIASSLVVLNPGMARLLNGFAEGLGLVAAVLIPYLVGGIIVLYEKFRLARPVLKSPYMLFLLCWSIEILLLFTVPRTQGWQSFVSGVIAG